QSVANPDVYLPRLPDVRQQRNEQTAAEKAAGVSQEDQHRAQDPEDKKPSAQFPRSRRTEDRQEKGCSEHIDGIGFGFTTVPQDMVGTGDQQQCPRDGGGPEKAAQSRYADHQGCAACQEGNQSQGIGTISQEERDSAF